MSAQVTESARSSRLRRSVTAAVAPIVERYGMAPPCRTEIEDRPSGVCVRLVFARRVPQYVGEQLAAAVTAELGEARTAVAVVTDRRNGPVFVHRGIR